MGKLINKILIQKSIITNKQIKTKTYGHKTIQANVERAHTQNVPPSQGEKRGGVEVL